MSNIVSLPVTPATPASYPTDPNALYLFRQYSRADYLAAFGEQAPAFDPAQPPRSWFDTGSPAGPYLGLGAAGLVPLQTPANVARPNIPGTYVYAPWNNPVTTPAQFTPFGQSGLTSMNGAALCSIQDALNLVISLNKFELGATFGGDQSASFWPGVPEWGGETRRYYVVNIGGQPFAASILLAQMYSSGVGAPGTWGPGPVWTPSPQITNNDLPQVPVPCRPLSADEAIEQVGLAGGLKLVKKGADPAPGNPASAGGLTVNQATQLAHIESMLETILGIKP